MFRLIPMLFLLVLLVLFRLSLLGSSFSLLLLLLFGSSFLSPSFLRADITDVLGLGDTGELDVFDHTDPGRLDLNIGA